MSEYELGQRVRFSNPLVRARVVLRHITVTEKYGDREVEQQRPINKEWLPTPSPGYEGIVVGKRTLANGYGGTETDYSEWSGSTSYIPVWEIAESFTAWLVVQDLRSKPVFVLPEHIEAIK